MRVLSLDLGKARVGLAVSDELGLLAHPRPPLDGRNRRAVLTAVRALVAELGAERVLVGYPLDASGQEGLAAARARRFADDLAAKVSVPVELVDERLTTLEASRRLEEAGVRSRDRRASVDGAAAAIVLQSWLDGSRARR